MLPVSIHCNGVRVSEFVRAVESRKDRGTFPQIGRVRENFADREPLKDVRRLVRAAVVYHDDVWNARADVSDNLLECPGVVVARKECANSQIAV